MPSFAILCVGRVGSEHLVSLLDSHPDVTCFSEIFAPAGATETQRGTLPVPHFADSPHERPASYWQELAAGLDTRLVGLKLPRSSITAHPDATVLIASPEVDIIRLSRRNRVAQYVSTRLALESGVWHSTQGEYGARTTWVDPAESLRVLDQIGSWEAELDELARGHRVFRMSYEELAAGQRIDELQSFLGVEPRELTSQYERLRDRPLQEVVENFDELAAALAGTPYSTDLDDAAWR